MKIISKHKDYYDYLQGIYGIDDLLVYDRRFSHFAKPDLDSNVFCNSYIFAICNKLYNVYHYKDKFYYTLDELKELEKILYIDKVNIVGSRTQFRAPNDWNKLQGRPTDVNTALRQPILLNVPYLGTWTYKDMRFSPVILDDFKFAKIIPAHDIFVEVSAFIAWMKDNPPLPNNQTNTEKIVSHGFDLKKSFRHRN